MFRKMIGFMAGALILCVVSSISFATPSGKEEKQAAKLKAAIDRLGIGRESRVEVTLRDKTKLKGYVSEITDDHFVIVDDKTNAAIDVAYPQVKKAKGKNFLTGEVIAVGVIVLILSILLAVGTATSRG